MDTTSSSIAKETKSESSKIDLDGWVSISPSPETVNRENETATKNPVSTPSDGTEALISTLSAWDWVTIDGLQLPAVSRNQERYVAVHMVQLKLLSKFPSDIPSEITRKFTMNSFKMSVAEAWTFNSINAVIRKFDLGCQLFTADDELVKLNDVQMFYWNVKLLNLNRVNREYEKAILEAETNIQLLATAMQLKEQVERDIQAVRAELGRLGANLDLAKI
ncbi:hypothetical protein L5515_002406 [Caenorhabditis briggsae]|uniref:Uncharacterized protein n=1 Tax=Caenorhabditis briggsae TaxID=6238 RepID=A0AAE9J4U1_CAEBR|nr:hypothetical protein L5515_002406 [Caenorhabditis briggsae]